MKVRILMNANARAVRNEKISAMLFLQYLSDRVKLRMTRSIGEIEEAVRECWDSDTDVVVLATGDGGLHRFLSGFVNHYLSRKLPDGSVKPFPVFATFRSGTANLVTGLLGLREKPQKAARQLFEVLKRAKSRADIPLMRQKLLAVSDGIQQRFGFMAGSGAVYNFFLEYYEGSRYSVRKFVKIFLHSAVSLFAGTGYINRLFSSMEARLHLDETLHRLSRWKMLVVSAIDAKVVFFRAFHVGRLIDRIHVKAGNPSRLAIIRNIPNLLFNRPLKGRELLDSLARSVLLERDADFGYTIDGELYNARRLSISPGPVVEFIQL